MRIEVRFNQDVAIVSLSGKFLAGADGPFLRQKVKDLFDAGTRKLVIDFAEVPYIDSTGLGFLAGARVTAQNAGALMVLSNLNPHVRRIVDHAKLTPFFVLADDEAAAVAKLHEAASSLTDSDPNAATGAKSKRRSSAATET